MNFSGVEIKFEKTLPVCDCVERLNLSDMNFSGVEIEDFRGAFLSCEKVGHFKQVFPVCGDIEYFRCEKVDISEKHLPSVERLNISEACPGSGEIEFFRKTFPGVER